METNVGEETNALHLAERGRAAEQREEKGKFLEAFEKEVFLEPSFIAADKLLLRRIRRVTESLCAKHFTTFSPSRRGRTLSESSLENSMQSPPRRARSEERFPV